MFAEEQICKYSMTWDSVGAHFENVAKSAKMNSNSLMQENIEKVCLTL